MSNALTARKLHRIQLSSRSDGYGFFYGQAEVDGRTHQINVLPPEPLWDGDFKLPGHEPHATDWVLFIDGEEAARASTRKDLEAGAFKQAVEAQASSQPRFRTILRKLLGAQP